MTGSLALTGVAKDFVTRSGTVRALDSVDLKIAGGEFVCVVGASGSGKSTLLSLVAGLTSADRGRDHARRPPGHRARARTAAWCSRPASLYPWRTVDANVAFGLELLPAVQAGARAAGRLVPRRRPASTELRNSLPKQLSGGQRQRVAIARALACEPDVLLLDEPFGALDVQTKEDMQVLVRRVWRDTGTTVLMVTHDVEEAVFLGQRVIVLACDPGRVAAEMAVPLPDARELSVKRTPEFLTLRASVEDMVRAQHRKHLARSGG